jgi:hypothetical protein
MDFKKIIFFVRLKARAWAALPFGRPCQKMVAIKLFFFIQPKTSNEKNYSIKYQ